MNLKREIRMTEGLLPSGFFNHERNNRLFWHNEMLVERMDTMLNSLALLTEHENPDICIFLGDLVNTNWSENVSYVGKKLGSFSYPVAAVTGNHDIYLKGAECRLQDFITPGQFETGFRSYLFDKIGLIFLDLFVRQEDEGFQKFFNPKCSFSGTTYRPKDVDAALDFLDQHPDHSFFLFCHLPVCPPQERLRVDGRKIGSASSYLPRLQERLTLSNNLLGIINGHCHFNHLQLFENGFHWNLPALVEYPCACGILETDGQYVQGRLVLPDETLTKLSLAEKKEQWPYGLDWEREFVWEKNHHRKR